MGRKKGQKNKKGATEEKQQEDESTVQEKKSETPPPSRSGDVQSTESQVKESVTSKQKNKKKSGTPPASRSGDVPSTESQVKESVTSKQKNKKGKKVDDKPESHSDNSKKLKPVDTLSSTSSDPAALAPKVEEKQKQKKGQKATDGKKQDEKKKPPAEVYSDVSVSVSTSNVQSDTSKQSSKKSKKQKKKEEESVTADVPEEYYTPRELSSERNEPQVSEKGLYIEEDHEQTDFPSLEFTTQSRKKRKNKKGQTINLEVPTTSAKSQTQRKQTDSSSKIQQKYISDAKSQTQIKQTDSSSKIQQKSISDAKSQTQIKQPDSSSKIQQKYISDAKYQTQIKQTDSSRKIQQKSISDHGSALPAEEFPSLDTKASKKPSQKKRVQANRDDQKLGRTASLVEGFSQLQLGVADSSKMTPLITATTRPVIEQAQGECFELTIPHRKTRSGTRGRSILIETNHLALTFRKLDRAVHYDVTITPSTPKKLFRKVMEEFRKLHYSNRYPAFDGTKNLYSSTELPFGQQIARDVTIYEEQNPRPYKVVIKFANFVDLTPLTKFMTANPDGIHHMVTPQEVIQCLDIVLRSAPALTCLPVGRSYFTPPKDQVLALGGGMEMYYGFYQSAIIGWKPFLNIDVAHKAFPTRQNVIDLILEMCDLKRDDLQKPLYRNQEDDVNRFIRMLKVRYEIPGKPSTRREYRVNGLEKSASEATFTPENGSEITVEKYFYKEKNIVLKYPHMPCLWVGNKDRVPHVLLPAEFCTIVEGQVINRKMSEKLTSAMIKQAATSTKVRKDKIMAAVRKARFNEDPCVREFGITINEEFTKINARVLEPPALTYNGKTVVKPAIGAWRPGKFLTGISLAHWTIVNLDNRGARVESLEEMVKLICSQAINLGMNIAQPQRPYQTLQLRYRKELQELVELFKKKKDLQLLIVVVPNAGPFYSYVKQAAELAVGCLTQCIRSFTVSRINVSTVINILQKVNAKLEGINHILNDRMDWMKRPYMIMGADVTHPSPDAKDKPSVAAVTASYDVGAFKYNICWRLQPPKVEIIEDLEAITREQLLFFYNNTKFKPERIIFFRDGVSEGQFPYVLNTEIQAIRRACTCLQPDGTYKPKITFLVVQKRHHTRFFPINPQDASKDKNLNVPVGTCVDTEITHPTALDFCLVSHASIQGVARPTKYRVLWDDADMSEDDLEQLAFYFCHMFSRCTRSVSYPAPTYYAHLAAARIMAYCETGKLNMNNLAQEQERLCIKENIIKGRPMFFV